MMPEDIKHDTPHTFSVKKLPKIALPIIVEGKYDKGKLKSIFDCRVITTEGFGIFNLKEKQALIKRVAENSGVILLTDSDGGGKQIRSFISGILPPEKIYQLYTPEIKGKEKRKKAPSKAGILGVEGISSQVLYKVFERFISSDGESFEEYTVSVCELFALGLTGQDNSMRKRDELSVKVGLPCGMGAKAMAAAIPMVLSKAEWEKIKEEISALN